MHASLRLVALLVLPALLVAAPARVHALTAHEAFADISVDDEDRPRRSSNSGSGLSKFLDLGNPKTLGLVLLAGGVLISYGTAPKGFTFLEENGTPASYVGIAMGLSTFVPGLAITEVIDDLDDGCLGLVLTIPIITVSYVLTLLILDWVDKGFTVGNTVFPLATGAVGAGAAVLIAGFKKGGGDRYADEAWQIGAGPVPDGVQLRLGRRF